MTDQPMLLAFYGDDFTGSTDAMEALAISNYRTVLFMDPPSLERLQGFPGLRCFGVAGTGRAKGPDAMERELRPIFAQLAELPVPLVHYKTCSTFDSSPQIGSIGKAIKISRDYFNGHGVIPILVGAPPLGRFTLFGQHFARMRDAIYRLDRHPTMSRHPVTPMTEADLGLHLGKQTTEEIALMDILELDEPIDQVKARFEGKISGDAGLVLFDVLDDERLCKCARLISERTSSARPQFVVGSSGWEYALTAYWKIMDMQPAKPVLEPGQVRSAKQILVVSGSCSPITQGQIQKALDQGFHGIRLSIEETTDFSRCPGSAFDEACSLLRQGMNVLVYTAMGPDDDSISRARDHLGNLGIGGFEAGAVLGRYLGVFTREVVFSSGVRRIVIAGGDTSGFVTREMGVYGLEMIFAVSPGAPLCKAYVDNRYLAGLELALKGGQMGDEDYFQQVLMAGTA